MPATTRTPARCLPGAGSRRPTDPHTSVAVDPGLGDAMLPIMSPQQVQAMLNAVHLH